MQVLLSSSVVVVAIASIAYYFGSGRNFCDYLQQYTDEVNIPFEFVIKRAVVCCRYL